MKISTIIPCYNTAKYLKRCINSVINQSIGFSNIELIIIDDGSTDNSAKIIKEFQRKYPNIKYCYQKNSGQGKARNYGLKMAHGNYISFVDSDDYIHPKMYEDLYQKAQDENYDIVTCDYNSLIDDAKKYYISFKKVLDSNKNFIIMNTGPCNMLIKHSFLKKRQFKFPVGINYEDLAIIPSLGIDSKIFHVEQAYYNYLIRDNSIMNTKFSKKLDDIFLAFANLYQEFVKFNAVDKYYAELEFIYIRRLMMSASLRFIACGDSNDSIFRVANIIAKKFPKWQNNMYYKKLPFRQKIVALLTYHHKNKLLQILYYLNNRRKR